MPIVVDGALFRTGPTESDPTRPANVQKNLSQPDPLKLINICIQYECKLFTICIDLHITKSWSDSQKLQNMWSYPTRGFIDLPVDNSDIPSYGFFWC